MLQITKSFPSALRPHHHLQGLALRVGNLLPLNDFAYPMFSSLVAMSYRINVSNIATATKAVPATFCDGSIKWLNHSNRFPIRLPPDPPIDRGRTQLSVKSYALQAQEFGSTSPNQGLILLTDFHRFVLEFSLNHLRLTAFTVRVLNTYQCSHGLQTQHHYFCGVSDYSKLPALVGSKPRAYHHSKFPALVGSKPRAYHHSKLPAREGSMPRANQFDVQFGIEGCQRLPTHLIASSRFLLMVLPPIGEGEAGDLDLDDNGFAEVPAVAAPAAPVAGGDGEPASAAPAAPAAGIVAHQKNNIFEPGMQGGLAVLIYETSTSQLANGLGPCNRFIQSRPQSVSLVQPLEMVIGHGAPEAVSWEEPFQRDPARQLALWAREHHYSRDELYSAVYHGLRERYFVQIRSGNFILLTLCKPYATSERSSNHGGRGNFGRGGAAPPTPAGGRGKQPNPLAPPFVPTTPVGLPGRGRGSHAPPAATRGPKPKKSSTATALKPPPEPDP